MVKYFASDETYPPPAGVATALAGIFGADALAAVQVRERVWWLKPLPWIRAITGPGRIWLRGSADNFFADPELVLHEYCHVLEQWDRRRLSVLRYLGESLRRGYWQNRFEVEARRFAARELPGFETRLAEARRLAEDRLALVELARDPGEQHTERQTHTG
jgi:hypothetical protein